LFSNQVEFLRMINLFFQEFIKFKVQISKPIKVLEE
jgi:hypothetical protein